MNHSLSKKENLVVDHPVYENPAGSEAPKTNNENHLTYIKIKKKTLIN